MSVYLREALIKNKLLQGGSLFDMDTYLRVGAKPNICGKNYI